MHSLTISGAYGRDYTSKTKVLADWNAGKDFICRGLSGSSYINKEGAERNGITRVNIRYSKDRKVTVVAVTGN